MSAQFLILGDLHFGRLETLFRQWEAWSFSPLKQAEKYARKHNIQHIIQTGDVHDEPNPKQSSLIKLIEFLRKSKLDWHFTLGNHDVSDKYKNSLVLLRYLSKKYHLKNCHVYLKPTRIIIDNIPIVFLPWPLTQHKLLEKGPAIVIAHIERSGARYDTGKVITGHDWQLGPHFWWVGHLHTPQIQKRLIYVGAPLQLRHGDNADKYLWHIQPKLTKLRMQCKYTRVKIKLPYKLKTVRINHLTEQAWQQEFKHLAPTTYLRLQVHSDVVLPQKYLNHPQVLKYEPFGKATVKTAFGELKVSPRLLGSPQERRKMLKLFLGKLGLRKRLLRQALQKAAQLEANLRTKTT